MERSDMIPAWVDGTLTPVEKLAVHRRGLRHQAISVFVLAEGAVLLQQRALGKYHSGGLWANACCTHPHWGESAADCATRRLEQELGLRDMAPHHAGQVEYRADVGGGLTEHEVVEMFWIVLERRPALRPDPAEVMALRWVTPQALAHEIAQSPQRFTAWLRIYHRDHRALIPGL